MTSNSAESMNALSVHARKLPVTMLLEFFRASVQQWFWNHRNTAAALTTPVTPYAERKLGKRNNRSRVWTVKPASKTVLQVFDNDRGGNVNLVARTCTCGQWQLSGLPCGHVMAVARHFNKRDVSEYVQAYFKTETYIAAYEESIYPLDHSDEWADPGDLQTVEAPILPKRQAGRPKKNARIPSRGEGPSQGSVKKCSRCLVYGHTRTTCTASYDHSSNPTQPRKSTSKSKSSAKGKEKASCSTQSEFGSTYQSYHLDED